MNAYYYYYRGLFTDAIGCCAGTRTFVHESIYDKFVTKATELARNRKVGDPFSEVDQGPQVIFKIILFLACHNYELAMTIYMSQVSELQFNRVMALIEAGKKEGATLATGGMRHGSEGYFIQPTVFADVKDNMRIAKEEVIYTFVLLFTYSN